MQISTHVEALQRQLIATAAAGTTETEEIAGRLVVALDASARVAILEALSEAAAEITRDLAPGAVDVRLRGRDVEFVVSRPAAILDAQAAVSAPRAGTVGDETDDGTAARTTLRWPDSLKSRAEAAAASEGLSLNTWLVRAVGAALDPRPVVRESSGSTFSGWVR